MSQKISREAVASSVSSSKWAFAPIANAVVNVEEVNTLIGSKSGKTFIQFDTDKDVAKGLNGEVQSLCMNPNQALRLMSALGLVTGYKKVAAKKGKAETVEPFEVDPAKIAALLADESVIEFEYTMPDKGTLTINVDEKESVTLSIE